MNTRQAGSNKENRLIAWNGLRLHIPQTWDARISGHRHLVFEKDFQPQLQIRWEKSNHRCARNLQKKLTQFSSQMGTVISDNKLPKELRQLKDIFKSVTCFQGEKKFVNGGVCLCGDCHTLILFQLLSADPAFLDEVSVCLATLSCHKLPEDPPKELWRIQDFSLAIPASFLLKDYTFGSGLTRLSFSSDHLMLHTCTLGPADTRLNRQTLEEILITLTNSPDLNIGPGKDNNSCEGYRSPTISKQILLRLHREKPFIHSKIWHDTKNNRILAVVLLSNRPISQTTTHKICRQYEIVQKKNTT